MIKIRTKKPFSLEDHSITPTTRTIYYECICGREWSRELKKGDFLSPGICICNSDYIAILSEEEVREKKLKRLLDNT